MSHITHPPDGVPLDFAAKVFLIDLARTLFQIGIILLAGAVTLLKHPIHDIIQQSVQLAGGNCNGGTHLDGILRYGPANRGSQSFIALNFNGEYIRAIGHTSDYFTHKKQSLYEKIKTPLR
jgi:hypothetical protein